MIRRVVLIAGRLLGVVLLVLWVIYLRPSSMGGPVTYLVVRGTSMLPTYAGGDLLLLAPDASYHRGDVVAYRVPAGEVGAGHVVIHRIIGGDGIDGFDVQGDNNPAPDPWHPVSGDIVGRPWLWFAGIGGVLGYLRQPVILAGLLASIVVAMVLSGESAPRGTRKRAWYRAFLRP